MDMGYEYPGIVIVGIAAPDGQLENPGYNKEKRS